MNMQEVYRFIDGLRRRGWTDTQINNFLMYIESGIEKETPPILPGDVKKDTEQ